MVATYTNSQIKGIIDEYIHSDRDREVLYYRLIHGLAMEQIAKKYEARHPDLSMSKDTVKRILKRCEPEIFRHVPAPEDDADLFVPQNCTEIAHKFP